MHRRPQNIELETRRSAVILALSALAVGGTAITLPLLRRPARDAKSACVSGSQPHKTLILVDRTDAWAPSTASLIAASLTRIADTSVIDGRLQLFPFDGSAAALPRYAFDRCKPPSTGNVVIETPQRLAKLHAERFTTPLLDAVQQLSKPSSFPRTELVQVLGIVAAHARLEAPAEATTLHVFSDMEENSAAFSFAKRPAQPLDLFAAHFAAAIGDRLKSISLHIHVLPPVGSTQRADPRVERAWRAAFIRHVIQFNWGTL